MVINVVYFDILKSGVLTTEEINNYSLCIQNFFLNNL